MLLHLAQRAADRMALWNLTVGWGGGAGGQAPTHRAGIIELASCFSWAETPRLVLVIHTGCGRRATE
jgi:hypothetical protein